MALNFSGAGDLVDHGSDASVDNLDPFTVTVWYRPTALANGDFIYAKGGLALFSNRGSGDIRLFVDRVSNTTYTSNSAPITVNAWNYVACTFDSSGASGEVINLYAGSLSAIAVEVSYGSTINGSGAVTDDAAEDARFGNDAGGNTMPGDIAVVGLHDALLTLGQIRDWQFRPRKFASTVIYSHYGFNGTGTQPDWSGNGNSGAVTGATVVDHVPLGPPFGFDPVLLPSPAAVAGADLEWMQQPQIVRPNLEVVAY